MQRLEEALTELLSDMKGSTALWDQLGASSCRDLFIGVFLEEYNQGILLSPALLQRAGEVGLSLAFDIYSAPGDREPVAE